MKQKLKDAEGELADAQEKLDRLECWRRTRRFSWFGHQSRLVYARVSTATGHLLSLPMFSPIVLRCFRSVYKNHRSLGSGPAFRNATRRFLAARSPFSVQNCSIIERAEDQARAEGPKSLSKRNYLCACLVAGPCPQPKRPQVSPFAFHGLDQLFQTEGLWQETKILAFRQM